ncbi:MAG: DUF2961 domain-containing protein [Planctomycetota bacterium]|nr:DUF2961 domain-containing protein [Planctomycetota bacterium]
MLIAAAFVPSTALSEQPVANQILPTVPIGLDAYRQWDRWPVQRIGVRAYMRSTYDRTGGNRKADAGNYLYQAADDFNVTLDVQSPGMLYFARYNHWHGSPWHYEVDGKDNTVQETTTADPNKPVKDSVFLPEDSFPNPLAFTWSTTRGADLSWVPIGFEKSFRMAYTRTRYGTGYYIYHQFLKGIPTSQPLKSWQITDQPAKDVLQLINRAGTDLVPTVDSDAGRAMLLRAVSGTVALEPSNPVTLTELTHPATIRAINFTVPKQQAIDFGRAKLRITWDGRQHASVDVPIALFFGTGTLYNREQREYLVRAFPVNIRFDNKRAYLNCYFTMPFFRSAKIELIGTNAKFNDVEWNVRYAPTEIPAADLTYFHATYADHPKPELGKDLVLLNTQQAEGGGDWSGHFIGTSFIFSHNADLTTLEGDPRFFFDDSQTPQAQGTGTEEWGGGGDYWGGKTMTLPFAGHPVGTPKPEEAKNDEDKIESAYRFLLADLMPFAKNAKICLEHGGDNDSKEHYKTVTYWYGAPYATLVKTDELNVGDSKSETDHAYHSPQASAPYEIKSKYELGRSHRLPDGTDSVPLQTVTGRKTTGTSEFTLNIDPANVGVMLRRTLDYSFPNQRAEVFIAEEYPAPSGEPLKWHSAGTWYLAGGSTFVHSNPPKELDATEHEVINSNRHLRDDEFLLPPALTAAKKQIRLKIVFQPVKRPLFPGHPLPELAWSEIAYSAYCYRLPIVAGPLEK